MHIYRIFRNKSDDNLYLFIRYLKNSRLKPFFGKKCPFVFVLAGREYLMDIVLLKDNVKCAVFKISDVQRFFTPLLYAQIKDKGREEI